MVSFSSAQSEALILPTLAMPLKRVASLAHSERNSLHQRQFDVQSISSHASSEWQTLLLRSSEPRTTTSFYGYPQYASVAGTAPSARVRVSNIKKTCILQLYKQQKQKRMDPTIKQKIETLEEQGELLQKEAKYKEALDAYEQVLHLNKINYGTQSEEYERVSIKLCELCNLISMILLQKEKFDLCLMFLKKGETFCLKDPKYTAVTYNNYACFYRKTNKLRTALMYLQSALELEWKSRKEDTLADTYLNLCAVLSQLGRHTQALENVLLSITILQQEFLNSGQINLERVPVLSIAYHNAGVELQYLKRLEESISFYDKAVLFAEKHLGEENNLVENLRNVLKNAHDSKDNCQKKERRVKEKDPEKQKVHRMRSTYVERPYTGTTKKSHKKDKYHS